MFRKRFHGGKLLESGAGADQATCSHAFWLWQLCVALVNRATVHLESLKQVQFPRLAGRAVACVDLQLLAVGGCAVGVVEAKTAVAIDELVVARGEKHWLELRVESAVVGVELYVCARRCTQAENIPAGCGGVVGSYFVVTTTDGGKQPLLVEVAGAARPLLHRGSVGRAAGAIVDACAAGFIHDRVIGGGGNAAAGHGDGEGLGTLDPTGVGISGHKHVRACGQRNAVDLARGRGEAVRSAPAPRSTAGR